jgi:hypothetical protein
MTREQKPSKDEINISHIPVAGVGGLGLIAIAGLTVYFLPPLRLAGVPTLLGGLVVGLTLVAARNRGARPWAIVGAALATAALVAVLVVIAHGQAVSQ